MNCLKARECIDPKVCQHLECLENYLQDLGAQFAARGFYDFGYYDGIIAERAMVQSMLRAKK